MRTSIILIFLNFFLMVTRQHYQHHTTLPRETVHVIKVGGENASDLRTAEWIANHHRSGERIAVAISALRTRPLNTTNELVKARDAYENL